MATKHIYSEEPETETWNLLLRFSYVSNLKKWFAKGQAPLDDTLADFIVGAMLQASDYFKATKEASLSIAPLLLYYGLTSLYSGLFALSQKKRPEIRSHGLRLSNEADENDVGRDHLLAATEVRACDLDVGSVHAFAKIFGLKTNLTSTGDWTLLDFLAGIPDLHGEIADCYGLSLAKVLPLDPVTVGPAGPEGGVTDTVDRIRVDEVAGAEKLIEDLACSADYGKNYFPPQATNKFHIFRRKLKFTDYCLRSISDQRYIPIPHQKQGQKIVLDVSMSAFMAAFVLGMLSRYHPAKWSRFVLTDTSGERHVIQKFIRVCLRQIPNIVANNVYETSFQFTREAARRAD